MAVSMAGQVCAACETTFSQGLQSQRVACPSCGRKLVGRVAAPMHPMQQTRDQGNNGASLPPLSNPSSPTNEVR